ncbi:MAG: GH92 family glycosyl hydrolase [Bacteroidaceae bacterium]|nr:GH92 family glycosyl hydrolase [Bacteroidaceae bacterium]
MLKRTFITECLLLLAATGFRAESLTDYVNPIIGTDNHGHVFVGANVPFGAIQAGPSHIGQGWDWCSCYNYTDDTILGFSHLHISGTGCSDLGDFLFMPVTGKVGLSRGKKEDLQSGYFSTYSHSRETMRPGYYAVELDRYNIKVELTTTERVAIHRYTFPEGTSLPKVVIDTENGNGDIPMDCHLKMVNDSTVVGYRISRGWAQRQYAFFAAIFSQPIKEWQLSIRNFAVPGNELTNPRAYGVASFAPLSKGELQVKVAISGVSEENALMNLRQEMPGWNFEQTRATADALWNKELGRIQAEFHSDVERTSFYTALYHVMIAPQLFCDINGDYRGSDGKVHLGADFKNYTTWSCWDTYRSYHPLATLILPEMQRDWYKTILHIHQEQGFLPIWHLMGNETGTMVGISSVPILADMCQRGFVAKEDLNEAYQAMCKTMGLNFRDLDKMNKYGYVPVSDETREDVAKSLEYGLNFWSLAQVAKMLGKDEDYRRYTELSKAYQKLYDPATGFIRPKDAEGHFESAEGFNPNYQTKSYTEGNPWQYLWLVPHDVSGLIKAMGGKKAFSAKLDGLFTASTDLGENAASDIAGLIGQYAHGNEPSHHIIYLYNYVGEPWKAANRLRETMSTFYQDGPAGLAGNEDVGQMSAWYILSAIGLYQVEPSGGRYLFGSPIVDHAILDLGYGDKLTINVKNNSETNKYVQSISLNGKNYPLTYIDYTQLRNATIDFTMGPRPSKFGVASSTWPVSR